MQDCLKFSLYIFDMGNVVIRNISTIEEIAHHYGFDVDELREDYDHYEFPLMDGTINSTLYWEHVAYQFGIRVEGDPLQEFFRPTWNEPMLEVIAQLRKLNKKVVCGSNTYAPHWEWLRREGYLKVFDELYASHEIGISKPSQRFFTHILRAEYQKPHNAFFIDDCAENIFSAQALGITTHHYTDDQSLRDYFKEIL